MSDVLELRTALFAALGLSACWSGSSSPPVDKPVTQPPVAVVTPPPPPAPADAAEPPPTQIDPSLLMNMPSCPTGTWCGAAAVAAKVAPAEATDRLGCKTQLNGWDAHGNPRTSVPADWPNQGLQMTLDETATQAKRAAHDATTCCYTWVEPCPGGRPLVVDGEVVTACVPAVDEANAAHWLAEAAAEHASIASFARAMLELMAVGAPPALLDDTAVAMRDEIRHAEACFAQAARFAGRPVEPGPLPAAPPRAADLARLAADTFLEGCAGESIAVLGAMRRRAACTDPAIARLLETIIADETRHAALAWRTVAWAIAQGGARVAEAVQVAATAANTNDAAWREVVMPTLAAVIAAA